MALERVPSDIRTAGGVARMSDPAMIEEIMAAVSIPVMAKCRIGHFVEAQILEALGVDYIDESEVLTPADEENHIDKHDFKVPFVCGCRDLGEALRRIGEGAAMIRTKGEAGTGNIVEAVRHMRTVMAEHPPAGLACARTSCSPPPRSCGAPLELVREVADAGQAAGRQLRGRRHRHPRRRGAGDAARRRGRLRRLRHLQERGPGPDGQRDRPGDDPLRQPQDPGRGQQGPGRADARHRRSRRSPRRSAWRFGAGSAASRRAAARRRERTRMRIGVLALQGAVREHVRDRSTSIGVEAVAVRLPEDLDGVDGLILPGGESTTMRRLIRRWGLREPIMELARSGAPMFGHLRRDDRARHGRSPTARSRSCRCSTSTVERNAFGRQLDSFETDLDVPDPRRAAGPRDLHPRPDRRARSAPRRRPGPPATTGGSSPSARAT